MPQEIIFPDVEPRYVFERDCLSFRALADGKPVECLVTVELFMAQFGVREPAEESMRQAYREHKTEIQEIARNHIENGWIDEERRIFLTTRHTRLTVIFDSLIGTWPEGRAAAEAAHRMLLHLVGPNAGEVSIEWSRVQGPQGRPGVQVRITDPSMPHFMVAVFFEPVDLTDSTTFSLHLARIWSSVLQARSRKLIIKSG